MKKIIRCGFCHKKLKMTPSQQKKTDVHFCSYAHKQYAKGFKALSKREFKKYLVAI